MHAVLAFGIALALAVMFSGLAQRSILSTAVLFLAVGFVIGPNVLGLVDLQPGDTAVKFVADLALFAVLFTDGMRCGLTELRGIWALPARAVLIGMPLTAGLTAVAAKLLTGLGWVEAFLAGAVLSPTDPVFASALVGREEVPEDLRQLLNVESGVNDGLALPAVVALIAVASPGGHASAVDLFGEVTGGLLIGIVVSLIVVYLTRLPVFRASETYENFIGLSIATIIYGLARITRANEFLAAFGAGVTMQTRTPEGREAFSPLGEWVAELLKLAALLLFGMLIAADKLWEVGWTGVAFVAVVLFVARPLALTISMIWSRLPWREILAAAWFGPKGFASVVFGIIVLQSPVMQANKIFHLVAATIIASIVLHSSTDYVVAKYFERVRQREKSG